MERDKKFLIQSAIINTMRFLSHNENHQENVAMIGSDMAELMSEDSCTLDEENKIKTAVMMGYIAGLQQSPEFSEDNIENKSKEMVEDAINGKEGYFLYEVPVEEVGCEEVSILTNKQLTPDEICEQVRHITNGSKTPIKEKIRQVEQSEFGTKLEDLKEHLQSEDDDSLPSSELDITASVN